MAARIKDGIVTSHKMQKTIVVRVERKYKERLTGKIVSTRKKFKVHCENKDIKEGDRVSFVECRPLSKDKKFRFLDLLQKSDVVASSTLDEVK